MCAILCQIILAYVYLKHYLIYSSFLQIIGSIYIKRLITSGSKPPKTYNICNIHIGIFNTHVHAETGAFICAAKNMHCIAHI